MDRPRTFLFVVAIAMTATFTLSACGGSSKSTTSPDTTQTTGAPADGDKGTQDAAGGASYSGGLDVCGLFTQGDAERALHGVKLKAQDLNVNSTCNFASVDPADGASVTVMYQPRALAMGSTVEEIATMAVDQLPGGSDGDVAPVEGIDGAFSIHKESMAQVLIPHDEGIVTVTAAIVVGDNDNLAASVDLAKVVAGNL